MADMDLYLQHISNDALTLHERLELVEGLDEKKDSEPVSEEAISLLKRWEQVVAPTGAKEALDRRLSWSSWSRATVSRCLDVEINEIADWAKRLPSLINTIQVWFKGKTKLLSPSLPQIQPESPLPFEELLLPFVAHALTELEQRFEGKTHEFWLNKMTDEARQRFTVVLFAQLAELTEWVLFKEFDRSRPIGLKLILARGKTKEEGGQVYYQPFIEQAGKDGLKEIFARYPVMARIVSVCISQWIENTSTTVNRLKDDWLDIAKFLDWEDQSKVKIIRTLGGLSDPHHEGQSVVGLRFSTGDRLVYKPRDLRVDTTFSELVKGEVRTPKCLVREDYGYTEFIEDKALSSHEETQTFFSNAGKLLFSVYLVGGTDCHWENVIAAGEYLVIIDSETLLEAELDTNEDDFDPIVDRLANSVLKAGLLPNWDFDPKDHSPVDRSGLGSALKGRAVAKRTGRQWEACNTDEMRRIDYELVNHSGSNEVLLEGESIDPGDYVEDIVDGFTRTYKTALSSEGKKRLKTVLKDFNGLSTRYIFRPTRHYSDILKQGFNTKALESGVAWGLNLESLCAIGQVYVEKPEWWPIVESEIIQMSQLDIPIFHVTTEGQLHGLPVPFKSSSMATQKRLNRLDNQDLDMQLELIRSTFIARQPLVELSRLEAQDNKPLETPILDSDACIAEATAIADELAKHVKWEGDESYWLGFCYKPKADCIELDVVGQGFYDGTLGVSLFLSAIDWLKGEDRYAHIWRHSLKPFRDMGEKPQEEYGNADQGISAGVGGLIYGAALMFRFIPETDHDWLMRSAHGAADLVSLKVAEVDPDIDLLGGFSGAVMGLLALYEVTEDKVLLEKAIHIGKHIVIDYRQRLQRDSQQALTQRPLAGLSHGASGIALTLARLFTATGDTYWREAVTDFLAYENALYEPEGHNWPDLRNKSSRYMTTWCHGAPGIALARVEINQALGQELYQDDWQRAINTTLATSERSVDHLCCGNIGFAEILLTNGLQRKRNDLQQAAWLRLSQAVAKANNRGAYRLFGGEADAFNPGFFQGTSGLGYQLLRFAKPDLFPSVLGFHL